MAFQKKTELVVDNLIKFFSQGHTTLTVLHGITQRFIQGNTYAITGASGTGKSTLLHLLAGLELPSSGNIIFNGITLQTMSEADRKIFFNKDIGLVFQQPYLIRELSVIENVMMPGIINGQSLALCRERARTILQLTGLADKETSQPSTLSGGQQQRVALARAVFNQPKFLLADELTGNLDPVTGKNIVDLLLTYRNEWGMGIIVTTHDTYVASRMDTIFQLHDGQLIDISSQESHAKNP